MLPEPLQKTPKEAAIFCAGLVLGENIIMSFTALNNFGEDPQPTFLIENWESVKSI